MRWLLRPYILVLVSAALVLSAAALVLWPRTPENKAIPQPVEKGDQEIVWLYAATNAAPWERFVTAIKTAKHRLEADHPELALQVDDQNAFPPQTTAVPELSLAVRGIKGRLWFRWYKLTSDLKTQDWVRALLDRRPPPLAIIGGGSSDLAIDLAHSLKDEALRHELGSTAPLLLITTATADEAPAEGSLNAIYAGRTFRFCFTNRHMAEAVTDFIWSQDDLRPDNDPFYSTFWRDDPYSEDLNQRFCDALAVRGLQSSARDWGWLAGYAALGGVPIDPAAVWIGQFRAATHFAESIPYSVGMFARPNRWEVEAARGLLKERLKEEYRTSQRPLLIVPGQSQPARRFLRALVRTAPVEARRFIVATGDAIAFNTVYRDRNEAWHVQDLPFSLVFFCHRNPVDRDAGFIPENGTEATAGNDSTSSSAGTEDLLLFVDIVESLVQGAYRDRTAGIAPSLVPSAEELRQVLSQARWLKDAARIRFDQGGQVFFDEGGNRHSGTGEHVVYLRPSIHGEEVLPRASILVCSWPPRKAPGHRLRPYKALEVDYEGASRQETEQ